MDGTSVNVVPKGGMEYLLMLSPRTGGALVNVCPHGTDGTLVSGCSQWKDGTLVNVLS